MVLTGLFALLATSLRYESWLLPPFIFFLVVLRLIRPRIDKRPAPGSILHLSIFFLVSNAFILMWTISCWMEWGDPIYFLHYSGNLDAPVIDAKIEAVGALRFMAYNLAFLPGVMLISLSLTTFLVSIIGLLTDFRNKLRNPLLWFLTLYIVFYLVTFVFSLERYPLARFTSVPGALLLVFSGSGVVYLQRRLRRTWASKLVALLVVAAAANLVFLANFSRPSDGLREKLRAVSPLSNPPRYFGEIADYLNEALAAGGDLVMDARNYNDRLLYLELQRHWDRIRQRWSDNHELETAVAQAPPDYLLLTSSPRTNHAVFEIAEDSTAIVGGRRYRPIHQAGIFTVFQVVAADR
jgi:hypothetical protein